MLPTCGLETKRQNTAGQKLTDTVFFFGFCPFLYFVLPLIFKVNMTIWKPALFLSSGKEVPNLVDTLNWAILSH